MKGEEIHHNTIRTGQQLVSSSMGWSDDPFELIEKGVFRGGKFDYRLTPSRLHPSPLWIGCHEILYDSLNSGVIHG